jgi:serine protease inhibitor
MSETWVSAACPMLTGCFVPEFVDFIPEFRADHPFLYMIRHSASNCPLFMGRVMNAVA